MLCPRLLLASSAWQTQCNHTSPVLPSQQSAFRVSQTGDCTQTLMFTRPPSTLCCFCIQCADKVSPIKRSLIHSLLEATFCRPHSCYRPASVQSLGQIYGSWTDFSWRKTESCSVSWNRFQLKENFLSCSVESGNGHCSGPHSKGLRASDDFFPAMMGPVMGCTAPCTMRWALGVGQCSGSTVSCS